MFSAKTKGFTCGIIAAVTYGMNPLFTLPLYEEGLNADSVLFYRYGLAIVLLALLMKWKVEAVDARGGPVAEEGNYSSGTCRVDFLQFITAVVFEL